jgi:uncharacterized membrane protein
MVMWANGWLSASVSSYLAVTMLELALCAALVAWLLWRMVAVRAVFWTASPILIVYAFQNWDLLAVAASVAGISLWWSGRSRLAAVAFAVGGAFKLYPALFIVPLVVDQLTLRKPRDAAEVALAGFGSLAAINLAFILFNASGWWATYRFHAERAPTTSGTIWSVVDPHLSTATENRASFIALAATLALITAALFRDRSARGYPVVEWCAAATAAFILLNKVSSPQYILWLIPFLALRRTRAVWWWLLSATALVRYTSLFGVNIIPIGTPNADRVVHAAVIAQSLLLGLYIADIVARHRSALAPLLPRSAPRPADVERAPAV